MKHVLVAVTAGLLAMALSAPTGATSNRSYKTNEYVLIDGGRAPDRRLAVAAHGGGEDGYEDFHLALVSGRARTVMARLPDIDPDNILDTAPKAFRAEWSPASRHVAVLFRASRHAQALRLYEIAGRNIRRIDMPDPIDAVIAAADIKPDTYDLRTRWIDLTWLGPARFRIEQRSLFTATAREFARALGAFAHENADGEAPLFVDVAVNAICDIGRDGRVRIVQTSPGSFD